jgi:hypothetical protein
MTNQTFSGQTAVKNAPTDQTNSTDFVMLKRLLLLAGLLAAGPAFAAGTVPGFSLVPQFDLNGKLAPGAKLYVIQAGTTSTPQNAYQDTALTQALPNPITADSAGRLPQWFVADGTIKLRLTTSTGTAIYTGDNLLVIGPSSGGGGGGGTVDPTTVLSTGDFKLVYNTGVLTGFVRCNGRTIGSATSGATERANADTSALFAFLWDADANLTVSGGRGASAAADFAANKTLALPDCRNVAMAGLGDMGNSDRGLFSGITFNSGNSTTLGSYLGSGTRTLQTANLPPYTPAGSVSSTLVNGGNTLYGFIAPGSNVGFGGTATGGAQTQITTLLSVSSSFAGTAQGGTSTAFGIVQPTLLMTIYIKL